MGRKSAIWPNWCYQQSKIVLSTPPSSMGSNIYASFSASANKLLSWYYILCLVRFWVWNGRIQLKIGQPRHSKNSQQISTVDQLCAVVFQWLWFLASKKRENIIIIFLLTWFCKFLHSNYLLQLALCTLVPMYMICWYLYEQVKKKFCFKNCSDLSLLE